MSNVQLCLCALHTDIERNGSNLNVPAAQQHIIQVNQYFKSYITSIESGDLNIIWIINFVDLLLTFLTTYNVFNYLSNNRYTLPM